MMQDRIVNFIRDHSDMDAERIKELMMNTQMLSKDLGTVIVGEEAVEEGLIQSVGGMKEALNKLRYCIKNN